MNLLTSRWSPTSSVCSMDCEGILKAWTTTLVPNSARITVTSRDSAYSRSEVRSFSPFRPTAVSASAMWAASAIFLFHSFLLSQELPECKPRRSLLGFFLAGARSRRHRPPSGAHFHQESLAMVGAALVHHPIFRRRQAASLEEFLQPRLIIGLPQVLRLLPKGISQQGPRHKASRRLQPGVQVDRRDDRFIRIRQHRGLFPAAGLL